MSYPHGLARGSLTELAHFIRRPRYGSIHSVYAGESHMMLIRNFILPLALSSGFATVFVSSPAFSAENKAADAALTEVLNEFRSLTTNPEAVTRMHSNGISVSLPSEHSITFFAAKGTPAFPAYVKRELRQENGKVVQDMNVICGAEKSVCDGFVQAYLEKTKRLQEAVKAKQGAK